MKQYTFKHPDCEMGAVVRTENKTQYFNRPEWKLPEGCGDNLKDGVYFVQAMENGNMWLIDYCATINDTSRTWEERNSFDFDDSYIQKSVWMPIPKTADEFAKIVEDSECGVIVIDTNSKEIFNYTQFFGVKNVLL